MSHRYIDPVQGPLYRWFRIAKDLTGCITNFHQLVHLVGSIRRTTINKVYLIWKGVPKYNARAICGPLDSAVEMRSVSRGGDTRRPNNGSIPRRIQACTIAKISSGNT